jgi:uncharacterized protein YbjT (DUF2867 family)
MVLILGATGMFGSRVLGETAARGAPVRALVHSPARAPEFERAGIDVAVGDLDAPDSLAGAFAGVDVVFLVTPMDDRIEIREHNALRAAQQAGVRRVVKLHGAVRHDGDPLDVQHQASIDAIKASGLSWALVSPNSVMETSLLSQADAVKQMGALFGSAGSGRVGLVAADDVARAAALVLTDRDETGVNYELTGPSALTMSDMATALSDVLGRPINYIDMPEADFRSLLVEQAGVPEDVADIQVMLHFAAWKRGDADLVTGTYRELTGQEPMSLEEWVAVNREAFEGPAGETGDGASTGA